MSEEIKKIGDVELDDLERVESGEAAEVQERAEEVADGVVLPIAPEDVDENADDDPVRSNRPIDFDDRDGDEEDHGRGLV